MQDGKSFARKVGCRFGRPEEWACNPYLQLRALISLTHELPIKLYLSLNINEIPFNSLLVLSKVLHFEQDPT